MVNELVPNFILNQMTQGKLSGDFHAVSLLVDISGFTRMATALMEHSNDGSEVIAEVLSTMFEPLIDIIYRYGGFVATFAGDAFTALFPTDPSTWPTDTEAAYLRAVLAAWQSSQFITNHRYQATRCGSFSFAVKISIADGLVNWGIWQSADGQDEKHWQQHAAYFFVGEAFDQCFATDPFVPAGGILLTEAVYTQLPPKAVTVHQVSPYWQLLALANSLVNHRLTTDVMTPSHDPVKQQLVSRFFPSGLLQRSITGEFRQVVAMFINLAALPTEQEGKQFQYTFFRLLAQYGGYLCTIGRIGRQDPVCTIILFWGAPMGYENNVSRALRFVLDLQQVAPIPIRVGATYHLAYAGFIGSAKRSEYTCYGIYVALAARQMTTARWGEILLDDFTAAQARKDFHVTAYGWHKFKGFVEEHPVYLLNRQRKRMNEGQDRVPLIGRKYELAQLYAHVQPIFQGKFGGVVIIMGEAGLGKSRLLREFQHVLADSPLSPADAHVHFMDQTDAQARKLADSRHVVTINPNFDQTTPTWFYCRTDEILRQPFNPFRYGLYHYFNQSNSHDLQLNRQYFVSKLDDLITVTVDPTLATELERLRSVLAALIDLPWEDAFYQKLDLDLRLDNILEALKTLIKAESCRHPLIIQLEDAQWLDEESRLLLEKLVHNIEEYPLLLLVTARSPSATEGAESGADAAILPALNPRTILQLQPLAKPDLRFLANCWLGGRITQDLFDLLQEKAKGNPFFAEQMLLYWQEQELLQWGEQGWQLQVNEELPYLEDPSPLSPNIRALLTARLDRLPPSVKTIVQTAAVLGHEFQRPVLTYMLQQDKLPPDSISRVEAVGIWHVVGSTACRFHHNLLCDAAYAMQSRTQLQKLHARAATAIIEVHHTEPQPHYAALVYHYYNAGDREQERRYARLAGIYAADNYLNREAARYFERALALTPQTALTERYKLSVACEAAHRWLGDSAAQLQDILRQETIAKSVNNQQWQAEAALKKADYERIAGNYNAAIGSIHAAVTLADMLGNDALLGQAHYMWGRILRHQGHYQDAHLQLQQALREARTSRPPSLEAHCLHEIGHLFYVQGSYTQASIYYRQAEAIYQQADHKRGQINCLLMFGAICSGKGDFAEAKHLYQKALLIARTLGWRPGEISCLSNLGNLYFDVGDYMAAHSYHFQALELCQEIGDREGEAVSLDTLGLIAQRQGDFASAERYYTNALTMQQRLGDQHGEAYTQTHFGYMWLALEQIVQAKECLQNALQIREKLGEQSAAIDSMAGLAFAQWKEQDLSSALQSAQVILHSLEEKGTDGVEFPVQVYLICYQIVDALAQRQPQYSQVAQTALDAAYQLVQERAAQIADAEVQRIFLECVPSNATVIALKNQKTRA